MRKLLVVLLIVGAYFWLGQLIPSQITCGFGLICTPNPISGVGSIATDQVRIDATAGVTCSSTIPTSDSTAGINTALVNAVAAGKTLVIPAGCKLGLGSPTAGGTNSAVIIPSGAKIHCEDTGAGFWPLTQHCDGGVYANAACLTNAECIPAGGGAAGTCISDFGAPIASPCTASTCFAPILGSVYTMLRDTAASTGIEIVNCSIWTNQADQYQRCQGAGAGSGDPCRQECNAPYGIPGDRCDSDANCGGNTCLRKEDCAGASGGGTCDGAPRTMVGLGKINALDLARTTYAVLNNVHVYDHFLGEVGIKTNGNVAMVDVDVAAATNNCSSPFTTPAASNCFGAGAGTCCYGTFKFIGPGNNTQPTVAVDNGIYVNAAAQGDASILTRVRSRGSTNAIVTDANTAVRLIQPTVVPLANFGPGTPSKGITVGTSGNVGTSSIVDGSLIYLASGATGITSTGPYVTIQGNSIGTSGISAHTTGISSTGAGATITENTVASTAWTTGISVTGANAYVSGNTLTGLNAVNAVGISIGGVRANVSDNYVEGNSTTGTAINATTGGSYGVITGNRIVSNAADTLKYGIVTNQGATTITDNKVVFVHDYAFSLTGTGALPQTVSGNQSYLSTARMTPTLQPIHVRADGAPNQTIIGENVFQGGWRGVVGLANANGLGNTMIVNNRFISLAGAATAVGGAGWMHMGNYINPSGAGVGREPVMVCDASCQGGSPVTRGILCTKDTDCTAGGNTCTSAEKCIPEAAAGYVGSPTIAIGAAHNSWTSNIMFNGHTFPEKQCRDGSGTATNDGAICQVDRDTCAGEAGFVSCAGGPPAVCVNSGASNGKLCCEGSGNNDCVARTPTPFLRVVDWASGTAGASLFNMQGNQIFTAAGGSDWIGLDMQSSGSLGNIQMVGSTIVGNMIDGASGASTYGIKFATTMAAGTVDNNINGNNFANLTDDVVGYKGTYGEMAFVPSMVGMQSDQTVTSTSYVDLTALTAPVLPNRLYDIYCHFSYVPSASTIGAMFALNGPAGATMITGRTCICDALNDCSVQSATAGVGTDTYNCFHFNAYNVGIATLDSKSSTGKGAVIEAILNNGATAGNLVARALSETSGGIAVKAGSFCRVTQMVKGS